MNRFFSSVKFNHYNFSHKFSRQNVATLLLKDGKLRVTRRSLGRGRFKDDVHVAVAFAAWQPNKPTLSINQQGNAIEVIFLTLITSSSSITVVGNWLEFMRFPVLVDVAIFQKMMMVMTAGICHRFFKGFCLFIILNWW